jgi:ATP-dependent exoDNAse (exonuclease V) alpha subunit
VILEGNERGYGAELARHLLNPRDNDHVTVHAIDGFVADDLFGAFAEAEAISSATQCQKYLFSLSLNPPPDADVSVEIFEETISEVEKRLGLSSQPHAVVFHEKNGRRHAHVVWSRIDSRRLKAINIAHYKRKLFGLSRELYQTYEWDMPNGFKDAKDRNPLNYSREEAGQAKRKKRDPKDLKVMFRQCWETSDSRAAFEAVLKEQGFSLARGDRRGFVGVDVDGKVWSLSRWCGVKPKEMRQRLGSEMALPTIQEVIDGRNGAPHQESAPDDAAFEAQRAKLNVRQRAEREALLRGQQQQRLRQMKERLARLPKGLRGLLARATGHYQMVLKQIDHEARETEQRFRQAQHALIKKHLSQRSALTRDAQWRKTTANFFSRVALDPRQTLILRADDLPYSKKQLLNSPDLVLDHVSEKKAAFKRSDVMRALAQRIDAPLALKAATDQAMSSGDLIVVTKDARAPTFTTRDYRKAEETLDLAADAMSSKDGFSVETAHIKRAVAAQDKQMYRAFGGSLSKEQKAALNHVLGKGQLSSVVGLAGAGKSTLLATARDAWERQGVKVYGAALAGKAGEELESASGIESRTLASLEMSWKNGYAPICAGDVLVIDEAGMVGTRQMARVAKKMNDIGAKLVLVGDPDQLQPIEAGTPFRRVVEGHGAAKLTEIHRQRIDWQKRASRELAAGDIRKAVGRYQKHDTVTQLGDRDSAIEALVETYAMDMASSGAGVSRLAFAHKRKDVHALNQGIRSALRSNEETEPEMLFTTETGQRAFAKDDRIAFTRNDKDVGVKNGMLGTVVSVNDTELAVALDGDAQRLIRFNPQEFQSFDHGYAVTIHKSQGATVDQAYVLASRSMDHHLAYVAMTRHRDDLRVFVNNQDRPNWGHDHRTHPTRENAREGPSMG